MAADMAIFEFTSIVYMITAAIGLLSLISALIVYISDSWKIRNKLKMATEDKLESALKSNDLHELGNSLENIVGKFNVYEYVTNPDVSDKIDRYVEKLSSFVGADDIVKLEKIPEPSIRSDVEINAPEEYIKKFYNNKYETWNILAKLRRDIEISLKKIAEQKGLDSFKGASPTRILNVLYNEKMIPESAYNNLKYSISISNRAIHGLDVDIEETKEAITHAYYAMELIKSYTLEQNI